MLNEIPAVQTLDSVIHWINHHPVDKFYENQLSYCVIHWLDFYSVDLVIHLSNWGLVFMLCWKNLRQQEFHPLLATPDFDY